MCLSVVDMVKGFQVLEDAITTKIGHLMGVVSVSSFWMDMIDIGYKGLGAIYLIVLILSTYDKMRRERKKDSLNDRNDL